MSIVLTLTAADGAISTLTVSDPNVTTVNSVPFNIGETTILSNADNGNGNLIVGQPVTLSQVGTLQSLSFYVTTVGGNLHLGIYSDASGNPGTKLAEVAEFTPVVGWNTKPTTTTPTLQPGNYWLVYFPQSNSLGFRNASTGGTSYYKTLTYGTMPTTFPSSPSSTTSHWSFYATLLGASSNTSSNTSSFPNASTTGYRTSLTPTSNNTITASGTYSGLSFTGPVSINANNVTLVDCLITGTANDQVELYINSGLTGIVIDHTTIIGNINNQNVGVYGIQIVGNAAITNIEIGYCDISHCQCVEVGAGPIYIHDCYFHDLGNASGDSTHWECVYYGGSAGGNAGFTLNIQHNTMINPLSQTAAIFLEDYFGKVAGVTINNNYLSCGAPSGQGGYIIYFDASKGGGTMVVTATNNALHKTESTYNYSAVGGSPTITQSGNYDADTLVSVTFS